MSDRNVTIAKNTLFLSLRMVFVLLISLYTSRVFLNVLGIVDYGISNAVAGFVSMFSFLNTSLSNGIQRFYNAEIGRSGRCGVTDVYNTSLVIQSVIAVSVVILLETVGLWYLYHKMVIPAERFHVAFWLYQFCTVSSAIVIMQSPYMAAIMAFEKMNAYALFSVIDVVCKLLFAIALPHMSADRLLMYGAFYLFVTVLNFVLCYAYSKMHFKELHFKRIYHKGMLKSMLKFSGWNLCGTFACVAREQGLNLVLNIFFGPVVNAARGVAYQVSSAFQGFVSNISVAAKPQIVQSYAEGEASRTMRLMFSMSKLSFIVLFILSMPILFNVDYVLHIWLGDAVPAHTAHFVVLVVLTNFMNNLNAPLSNVVYATGQMRNYQLTFSILNLLIIPLSYIALRSGARPEMAFVIYLCMSVVVQFGCLLVMRGMVSLSLTKYFKEIVMPLALISIIVCPVLYVVNLVMQEGMVRLLTLFAVSGILSSAVFYYIALDQAEKAVVRSIVDRIKFRR